MSDISPLRDVPPRDEPDQISSRAKADASLCDTCDLAREADHRIANHLAMLSSYVALKREDLAHRSGASSTASIQLAFDDIRMQIETLSRLHRSLATRLHGEEIDISEYLHEVCAAFEPGLSGAIEVVEDLKPGCHVRADQILPLTQIVSEVITNAIKYSHARGETGKVSVSCHALTSQELKIEIIDDGTGLPQLLDPRTNGGLGFRLIRALTAKTGAQSGFESSTTGTRFWLRIDRAQVGSKRE